MRDIIKLHHNQIVGDLPTMLPNNKMSHGICNYRGGRQTYSQRLFSDIGLGAAAVGSYSARSSRSGGMRWRAGRRSYEQRHVAEMVGWRWPRCEAPQSDGGWAAVGGRRWWVGSGSATRAFESKWAWAAARV
jgi:hypothetical protein